MLSLLVRSSNLLPLAQSQVQFNHFLNSTSALAIPFFYSVQGVSYYIFRKTERDEKPSQSSELFYGTRRKSLGAYYL